MCQQFDEQVGQRFGYHSMYYATLLPCPALSTSDPPTSRFLGTHAHTQVTGICLEYISNMLNLYQANPSSWRSKVTDNTICPQNIRPIRHYSLSIGAHAHVMCACAHVCTSVCVCVLQDAALQLFLAVTVRAESAVKGASAINERVNVVDFFGSHVLPELEDVNVNARHIIRADCLKFVSTFRQHFSVEALRGLMPLLIAHMSATPVVLQTYAASCIERLLNVKEKSSLTNQWVRKLDRSALQPFLEVGSESQA